MIRLENVKKMSWRHLRKTSWRRFEDAFKMSWQNVFKMSNFEDVLKTFLQDVLKTSWKRFENVWRRLEDVLLRPIWSSWSRCLKDLFKTSSSRRIFGGLSACAKNTIRIFLDLKDKFFPKRYSSFYFLVFIVEIDFIGA